MKNFNISKSLISFYSLSPIKLFENYLNGSRIKKKVQYTIALDLTFNLYQ